MDLDELAVGVVRALLVRGPGGAAGVDHGVRALAEHHARAARREHDRRGGERVYLDAGQVERGDAAAASRLVDHRRAELPLLQFPDAPRGLVAAHLFVEGVDELLARGRSGEGRAMEERAAEAAEVEESFRGAVERYAHAVEEEDDPRAGLAHRLHGRLVGEEVAAVDRVVEVSPGRVALPLPVDRGVDPALCAHRVRAFDRHDGEEVDREPRFGDPDGGHEAREPTPDDDEAGLGHGHARNAMRMANAVPYMTTKKPRHTARSVRCARWPTVMPHVTQKVQMPLVKWKTEASTPTRYAVNVIGSTIMRCMKP